VIEARCAHEIDDNSAVALISLTVREPDFRHRRGGDRPHQSLDRLAAAEHEVHLRRAGVGRSLPTAR